MAAAVEQVVIVVSPAPGMRHCAAWQKPPRRAHRGGQAVERTPP